MPAEVTMGEPARRNVAARTIAVVGVVAAFLHFWQMYKTMVGGKK